VAGATARLAGDARVSPVVGTALGERRRIRAIIGLQPREERVMGAVRTSCVDAARGLYEAFAKGDVPTVVAGMDAKIEWREAEGNPYEPSGAAWVGSDAIIDNLFMKLAAEWDGFAVHPQRYHDAGDTVVVEGRYSGTYKTTGVDLDAQFCHVFTFENDKVTSFQQYTDTAQLQVAMAATS
jgi:ketosteroid isomerase-like protein